MAADKNTVCGHFQARNPQSPVRIREGSTPKTPRNRGNFSGCSWMRARSLCNSRLGGGASRIRTLSTLWRIWSESEPPNLATEKNAGDSARYVPNPRSPVRLREADRPKPRGIAGFSATLRAVTSKSLQPQTGWRWRQSGANSSLLSASLIYGKIQGNPSKLDPPGTFSAGIPKPFRGYSDRFPVIRNREISASEHGFPPGRPHAGPRATIVPASSIRELLAFWVGRLLAHYGEAACPPSPPPSTSTTARPMR